MNQNVKKISIANFLRKNIITIVFFLLILVGLILNTQTPYFYTKELINKFVQYSFFVLALLIPIKAGLGLNFGIVIGAMSGQIGLLIALNKGLSDFSGLLVAFLFATLISLILGILSGLIINKAKGHEMITSLFLGYLANGLYLLILLNLIGFIIPFSKQYLLNQGIGLVNSIPLDNIFSNSLDNILQINFLVVIIIFSFLALLYNLYKFYKKNIKINTILIFKIVSLFLLILFSFLILFFNILPNNLLSLRTLNFPVITGLLILSFALYNKFFNLSKLGKKIENLSFNKDNSTNSSNCKLRVTAIMLSTIFAAWGQIISLQNIGFLNTYGSHMSTNILPSVMLLVGGASIYKAKLSNALLGILLFQGFLVITIPSLNNLISPNIIGILQTIITNGLLVYGFIISKKSSKTYTLNNIN